MAFQLRFNGIEPHEWRQSDCIRTVALKRFDGVLFGGTAYVAAFRIQNHRHGGRDLANVGDQLLSLWFGAVCCEISDLRFECTHQVMGGIHNGSTKIKNVCGLVAKLRGEFGGLGVKADTQQRLVRLRGLK